MSALFRLPRLSRSAWALLMGVLLTHLGWYLVLPFLVVVLTGRKGLAPGQAGLVLGVASLAFLAGSLLGGPMADRFGRRATLVVALVTRSLGLAGFAVLGALPTLLGTAAVAGLGGGIFAPAAKAGIAAAISGTLRSTAFSLRGIAANMGTSVGPLIGGWLLAGPLPYLIGAAVAVHLALAALLLLLLDRDCRPGEENCAPTPAGALRSILADRPFLAFSALTALIWALFAQLTVALPLRAAAILAAPGLIGLLWTLRSVLLIALQLPVTRLLSARLHPLGAVALGTLLLGAGLGSVAFARNLTVLAVSMAIFVCGEMLVVPMVDATVSQVAGPESLGGYFGVAALSWGAGEGLGNLVGGQLMGKLAPVRPEWPWLIYAASGLGLAAGIWGLRRWMPVGRPPGPIDGLSGSLSQAAGVGRIPLATGAGRRPDS